MLSEHLTFLSLLREAASCQTGSMSTGLNFCHTLNKYLSHHNWPALWGTQSWTLLSKKKGVSFFLSNNGATKMSGVPWHKISSGLMDFGYFLPFLRNEGINIKGAWHPPLQQWLSSEQALSHVEGSQGHKGVGTHFLHCLSLSESEALLSVPRVVWVGSKWSLCKRHLRPSSASITGTVAIVLVVPL